MTRLVHNFHLYQPFTGNFSYIFEFASLEQESINQKLENFRVVKDPEISYFVFATKDENGKKQGPCVVYEGMEDAKGFRHFSMCGQGNFVDDKLSGEQVFTNTDGVEQKFECLNGEKHGTWQANYPDGRIAQGAYAHDKKIGVWMDKDSNRQVTAVYDQNGVLQSEHFEYTRNGKLVREENLRFHERKFEKHGRQQTVGDEKTVVENYAEDMRHGVYCEETATSRMIGYYSIGQREGLWYTRKNDGSSLTEIYKNDQREGLVRETEADGSYTEKYYKGKKFINYKDDIHDGWRKKFDTKGKLTSLSIYETEEEENQGYSVNDLIDKITDERYYVSKAVNRRLHNLQWQDNLLGLVGIKRRSTVEKNCDQLKVLMNEMPLLVQKAQAISRGLKSAAQSASDSLGL